MIDGNSLVYRAFYALPTTLANKKGQITNAVYGFTSMLIKIFDELKPDKVLVAFDSKGPTFRHKAFKEYKAHRPETPDELIQQFPLIKDVLEALNIPIFELQGYEADDILATMAKEGEKKDYQVLVVTGDKDAFQLVSPQTKVVTTKKGITDIVIYNREKVEERYGLPPEKMIDMLGLKGDPSDNIPGVPSVGEKTAAKLLKEFGSLEEVLANISEIKGEKLKNALKEFEDQARLSKELATLDYQVPLEFDLEKVCFGDWDKEKVQEVFSLLELNKLLKRLFKDESMEITPQPESTTIKTKIKEVSSRKELESAITKLSKAKEVAVTLVLGELNLFGGGLVGICLADSNDASYYVNFEKISDLSPLKELLLSVKPKIITHDAKPLILSLNQQGLDVDEVYFDTMIAAYLLNPSKGKYPLSELALEYSGISLTGGDDLKEAGMNAQAIIVLKKDLETLLNQKKLDKLFYQVEMPLVKVLAKMEEAGVGLDVDYLNKLAQEMGEEIKKLEKEIFELSGEEFNLNSPQQLSTILFEKLKLPVIKRIKTGFSTDSSVLLKLINSHPVIEKILTFRGLAKLKSTYIDVLPKLISPDDGRLHTSFNQAVTATGRLSSSDPNLQNIPVRTEIGRKIREAFVPRDDQHKLLVADYSQIELRVLAHLSEDQQLIKAFEEEKDIHTATASEVFEVDEKEVTVNMRRRAKAVNFGIVYGISAFGLSENLGISKEDAKTYIEKYFNRYPKVKQFIDDTITQAYQDGYVKTVLGRIRYLPELKSSNNRMRNFGERTAINTPIQGSAADIIKMAMIKVDEELVKQGLQTQMVLQVHDELIFEVPKGEETKTEGLVRKAMEEIYPLKVELKVDIAIGSNWREAK